MFKKLNLFLLISGLLVTGCSKPDPILPGERTAVFNTAQMLRHDVPAPNTEPLVFNVAPCPYRLDSENIIWDDNRKIFSGFGMKNFVVTDKKPVCSGGMVYAGLTTGEVVKLNPKSRSIAWIADVFSPSAMTGGSHLLDIVAPIVVADGFVYAGGLGDAFCKLNAKNGNVVWCAPIGVSTEFLITKDVAFVVGTNNVLYALNIRDGGVYWNADIESPTAPKLQDGIITVGDENFDAATGIKD